MTLNIAQKLLLVASLMAMSLAGLSIIPNTQEHKSMATGDLVAVGDVHGCLDCLMNTLEANGVVDSDGRWIAGKRTVVQLGDILGRGADDHKVIHHIRRLSSEASLAGGNWVQLLGNHEDMELNGDFRYAKDGPDAGYGTTSARAKAFSQGNPDGDWLRSLPVIYQWEGIVFVHGGLSIPELAQFGVETINRYARIPNTREQIVNHILWDRTLTLRKEKDVCPILDQVLDALGAHTMVVGHTITASAGFAPGELAERCDGKLRMTDVGMSDAFENIPKFNRAAHFFSIEAQSVAN